MTSLEKQISLRASKIFSFDVPPITRIVKGQNIFKSMKDEEVRKIIEENIDTAIKQSNYLKKYYP